MKEVKDEVINEITENDLDQTTILETAENEIKETQLEEKNKEIKEEEKYIKDEDETIKKDDIKDDIKDDKKDKKKASEKLVKEKSSKPVSKKTKIIVSIVVICLLVVGFLFSTIFAFLRSGSDTIANGVSIKGIDVSGLTQEEAYEKVNSVISKKLTDDFDLIHNDSITTVVPEQFGATFDINSSIKTAYNIGREDNIFKNNYKILSALLFKIDINPGFTYDESMIDTLVAEIQDNLPDKMIEPSYSIDGKELIVAKGKDGIAIDSNALKLKIIANLNNIYNNNENIDIPVINAKAEDINLEKIYEEVHTEAKDAYFTKDPFTVYPHVVGVDFAISMDEAKKLLTEDKESYSIPLNFTNPKVTINEIGTEAFPNLLANYSTTYSTANYSRSTNIRLASEKINGTVLMPGQVFSYNSTVGQRTAAAGYKEAAVYSGGEVTTGIGGGICQVSSTLYNSVLLSNLEIVERYNHGFNPGYVPAGRDATVSWGGPDFKFKNSRNFPIKIVCSGTGGTINVKIYGLKEDDEPEIEIQSWITSYISYKTIEREDNTLNKGETKVLEKGSNGCKSVCYRVLKKNGQEISKTLLSSDTYSPHNRIVLVGTKENKPAQPTTPTEPTTPSNPDPNTPADPTTPTDPTESVTVTP